MINEALATGVDGRYRFKMKGGPARSSGRILTYAVTADPAFRPRGACPSYFTDENGVIHLTLEDRLATAEDPLLQ